MYNERRYVDFVCVFQEMGFTRQQAEAAIKIYGTVSAALDSLLAGVGMCFLDLRNQSHSKLSHSLIYHSLYNIYISTVSL